MRAFLAIGILGIWFWSCNDPLPSSKVHYFPERALYEWLVLLLDKIHPEGIGENLELATALVRHHEKIQIPGWKTLPFLLALGELQSEFEKKKLSKTKWGIWGISEKSLVYLEEISQAKIDRNFDIYEPSFQLKILNQLLYLKSPLATSFESMMVEILDQPWDEKKFYPVYKKYEKGLHLGPDLERIPAK